MDKYYIPVTVEEGMFSNEKTVFFSEGNRTVSLIVDADDIVDNKLRVRVVQRMNDQVVIDLPREPFSGGARLSVPATIVSVESQFSLMVLCDSEIQAALVNGTLTIDPRPKPEDFTTSAVDLHLGNEFKQWEKPVGGVQMIIDPGADDFSCLDLARTYLNHCTHDPLRISR